MCAHFQSECKVVCSVVLENVTDQHTTNETTSKKDLEVHKCFFLKEQALVIRAAMAEARL